MLGVTDLATYTLGAFIIILLPGPNSLYVLSVAARRDRQAGYRAAMGVFLGDTVLITLSAAGVASLLRTNPALFDIVKYGGAAYLIWIGIGMLRSARGLWREHRAALTGAQVAADPAEAESTATERPFRRALVISLLNPKAILFFVSFFIQFVDPAYPHPVVSFALLGLILQVFSFLYLSTLILTGTALAAQFRRRRRLAAGLASGAAALFVGFAAKLATSSAG